MHNCAHSTPLAWNVLPLIPYTAASYLSSHKFLREALPSHPNQMELLASVSHPLSFCMFPPEHSECVLVEDILLTVIGDIY